MNSELHLLELKVVIEKIEISDWATPIVPVVKHAKSEFVEIIKS